MKLANRVLGQKLALLLATPTLFIAGAGTASAQPAATADAKETMAVRHFENVHFQKCLDADTNTGGDGGKVQLWTCGPWNQQEWDVWPDGHLYNMRFQKCLDADTNTGGDGGKVQLWTCGPWNQQYWTLRADGSIYNERFQRCLDADINTGGDGGKVQLWRCGPWNQQWWRW